MQFLALFDIHSRGDKLQTAVQIQRSAVKPFSVCLLCQSRGVDAVGSVCYISVANPRSTIVIDVGRLVHSRFRLVACSCSGAWHELTLELAVYDIVSVGIGVIHIIVV